LAVAGSASKAENVNAALAVATGEIIAVFDADHHPEPGCFERAWPTLAAGADVVQGRCAVRLGDRLPSAIVAAEFEQMYGVSHPGRARLHGFGIFGGSNGFWRADALRRHRLDPTMLTEDIDVSMRVIAAGGRIAVDPSLVPGNSRRRRSPPCATSEPAGPKAGWRSGSPISAAWSAPTTSRSASGRAC
jgi:cellulose synthase/poly-beta-1,6-N-acetylglucosamine synthase-like glycosyltransferase